MSSPPDTVTVLECPNGSRVYLVGTAHFSLASVEDVKKTINDVRPHSVVLELCRERKGILEVSEDKILEQSERMTWQTIREMINREGMVSGLTQAMFIKLSAKIMNKLGVVPAGEFRAGFREGLRNGSKVYLGDREIRVTFKRALNSLPLMQQLKFMKIMLHSMIFDFDISIDDVEKMKKSDMLELFIGELSKELPALSKVFVDERDTFLTHYLMMAANCIQTPNGQPQRVVGVVGMGHVNGIKSRWMSEECRNVRELLTIPKPHWTTRVFWGGVKWGLITSLTLGTLWFGVKVTRFLMNRFPLILNLTHRTANYLHSLYYKH